MASSTPGSIPTEAKTIAEKLDVTQETGDAFMLFTLSTPGQFATAAWDLSCHLFPCWVSALNGRALLVYSGCSGGMLHSYIWDSFWPGALLGH